MKDGRRSPIDPVELLERLVRIDSVNPSMGGPGEAEIAAYLADLLRREGLHVSMPEVVDGRPNVIADVAGDPRTPTLLLETHLDTVAMPQRERAVDRTGDLLVGRGACDAKASCAAMAAAVLEVARDSGRHLGLVFAAVVDEEALMRGSRALVDQLPPVDGAIVGEPTSLRPVRAHNGIMRFDVIARGRAAHTSRADAGVNAISVASRFVTALDAEVIPRVRERVHPLTGRALLTPAVIHGGVAPNTVPDRCQIAIDRRLAPGESPEDALAEIDALLEGLRDRGDDLTRGDPWIVLPAMETPATNPLVRASEEAVAEVLGHRIQAEGVPFGTDGSNLSGIGGIPCVVLGPGSIDVAHADVESVSLSEVRMATRIYADLMGRFAERSGAAAWV